MRRSSRQKRPPQNSSGLARAPEKQTDAKKASLAAKRLNDPENRSATSRITVPSPHPGITSPLIAAATTPKLQSAKSVPILWKEIGDKPKFPSSLVEILSEDRRRAKPAFRNSYDPNYRVFEWHVDCVARWENRSPKLFDSKSNDWIFINHLVGGNFYPAPESIFNLIFDGLIWYDQRGSEHTEKRFHPSSPRPIDSQKSGKQTGILERPPKESSMPTPKLVKSHVPKKGKGTAFQPADATGSRRRRESPLTQPQTITDSAGNIVDVSHLIGTKYRRSRATQHLRTMPDHLVYKLTVAVVVVRALGGGLERQIDWPLVTGVFPDEEEQSLRDVWKTVSKKDRREINQLSDSFQDKFPKAYAAGEVQPINFDDLDKVNWEGLVQWALAHLDKPVMNEIPDLPASKIEFDESVDTIIERHPRLYRELFAYAQGVTNPAKEAAISAIPFAVPLPISPSASPDHPPHLPDPTDDNITDHALARAKSWAISTVSTPLHKFDVASAQAKLQSLAATAAQSEALMASAMKSLTAAKAVMKKRDKAADSKGRTYDLSRVFTDALDQRRTINATMLQQAVRYKLSTLDTAFRKNETVKFQPMSVEDGDMVAILNLVANARIKIKIGDDVSRSRWGIDQESRYQTRNMKKESLYFTVLMDQIPERYVFGNPLQQKELQAPLPHPGVMKNDFIPLWRDIHGGFQPDFWNLALASVLGILASRPGASDREVSKMMSPTLAEWEVHCILAWCVDIGAAKRTGTGTGADAGTDDAPEAKDDRDQLSSNPPISSWTGGWEVTEWWWMTLSYSKAEPDVLQHYQ